MSLTLNIEPVKRKRLLRGIFVFTLVAVVFGTAIIVSAQNVRNTDYSPDQSLKANARVNPSTLAV